MSNAKTSVLFVCLGNICRSPAAEAVFNKLLKDKALNERFFIDSAGTSSHHVGEKADSRMISAAQKRGICITSRSRQFEKVDFEKFDFIVVMDESNYQNVLKLDLHNEHEHKVSKMTDYCSGSYQEYNKVPDPYWGGTEGFELVLNILGNAGQGLLAKL